MMHFIIFIVRCWIHFHFYHCFIKKSVFYNLSSKMSQANSPDENGLNIRSIVLDKLLDDPQMKEVVVMEVDFDFFLKHQKNWFCLI